MSEYATYKVWDRCSAPCNLEANGRLIGHRVFSAISSERTCHDDGIGVFRCDACGAFAKLDAVTDCCTTIPIRYCPNCGAKVVEP